MIFRTELRSTDPDEAESLLLALNVFNPYDIPVAKQAFHDSNHRFICAEDNGRLVGYICFGEIVGTLGSFEVYWFAVDGAIRSQGLGSQMLMSAEKAMQELGARQIFISTGSIEQFAPVRSFYEKRGYEKIATMPDYYTPGDDRVVYMKKISHCVFPSNLL
jgi:ribosomal protein S18 acetylase RimI-like enzyme